MIAFPFSRLPGFRFGCGNTARCRTQVGAGLSIWICLLGLGQAQPATPKWSDARQAPTDQQVAGAMAAAKPLAQQLAAVAKPMTAPRPTPNNSPYTNSIILFDGENHTVVPVGSVLNLPPQLRNRVASSPKGEFTFWPDFLKRNASWLGTKEVPLAMARGDAKAGANILRETAGNPRLLVSVHRNCPITILEAPRQQAAVGK